MRWPWVSRALYEHALRDIIAERAAYIMLSDRHERLMQQVIDLKREGFGTTAPVPVIPEPELPPALLMQAIQAVSPVQDMTYAANFAYAMRLRDKWNDADVVRKAAETILNGRHTFDTFDS